MEKRPAIFLDRDGTINIEKHYLHLAKDWEWIPGAIDAMIRFKSAGYLIVVISNQAGLARGYYRESDLLDLHSWVNQQLSPSHAEIDAFYFRPHHPDFSKEACDCRKPLPGLILRATQEWDIDTPHSWMIGDKLSDVQAGCTAGCQSVLVQTVYGAEISPDQLPKGTHIAKDLVEASQYILAKSQPARF
ncbi:MAG: D-glycero-beta-D-manno-heptose 1,7-bisphosphate 7-phosphatase [Candidatus Omnitrophota bacterium]